MRSGRDGLFPVFVYPNTLKFYLNDRSTHKQYIKVYNPCDFPIRFKVLCTAPDKYCVFDPEGSIKAYHYVELMVKPDEVSLSSCNVSDKFRIQIIDHVTKQVMGRKDIIATLLPGIPSEDRSTPEKDNFENLPSLSETKQTQYSIQKSASSERTPNPSLVVLLTGLICIGALLLPDEGESSTIPLQLSFNMKLIFAYVLGLVTMAIFKP